MTVLGYFNSLRELGGARRILEEEVQNTIKAYGARKRIGEERGLFQDRKTFSEVVELTSRVSTDKVAEARRRLGVRLPRDKQRVDCAIATNMISVGLDIPRLGLMVVLGQPKTHAEYIQATSRVGRDDAAAGPRRHAPQRPQAARPLPLRALPPLPRDLLPLGRGGERHAVLGARARPRLRRGAGGARAPRASRADSAAGRGADRRRSGRARAAARSRCSGRVSSSSRSPTTTSATSGSCGVQNRVVDLLDSWRKIFEDYRAAGVDMQYQKYELDGPKPLLREMLDHDFEIRAPPEVPGEPLAARRGARGEPVPQGPERRRRGGRAMSRKAMGRSGAARSSPPTGRAR